MSFVNSIKNIGNTKDGKILIQNFAYLSLLQVVSYVFPIITLPYLARVIGVDGFGKIAFSSAVMVWIQTFADWGFNYTATRDVAQNRDNHDEVSKIFSNVFWARVCLMIISFIFLLCLIICIPTFKENSLILLVSFLMIPGHLLFPEWFFQAVEQMKYITISTVISKAVFTLAIFFFIKDKNDYIFQPLLLSFGYLVAGIISLYCILVQWKYKLYKPSIKKIVYTIRKSSNVFLNELMPNLYNSFSVVLLGFFGGSTANGKLDAATKFVTICQSLMQVISRTFFPFLSRKPDKHKYYERGCISISLLLSFFVFVFAPVLIKIFYSNEFQDSILVLRILSISVVFLTMINVYGTNYMIIKGHEQLLRKITTIVSVIGFFIAIPLVYQFHVIGAAITTTLTRSILGLSIMFNALRLKKCNNE